MRKSHAIGMLMKLPAVAVLALATACSSMSDTDAPKEAPMIPPHCNPSPAATDFPLPLGCANAANLRAMLDDPKDADAGRALGPASGARESTAVSAYQQNKIKPFDSGQNPGVQLPLMSTTTDRSQ